MSAKSILEADGKAILNYHLTRAPVIKPTPLPASSTHNPPPKLASLYFAADADIKGVLDQAEVTYPWLLVPGAKFVAKPDQLIKRRGKSGLLALNKPWAEAREWIEARAGKEQKVETVDGVLRQFLVEPFVPHPQDTEYYININSVREVRLFFSSFCPSCRLAIVRGVVSPEAVFGRARCALARIHLGERLLQKWERTAGSVYSGASSGFV
jgi:ATP citrate (pro-S)-lyase